MVGAIYGASRGLVLAMSWACDTRSRRRVDWLLLDRHPTHVCAVLATSVVAAYAATLATLV